MPAWCGVIVTYDRRANSPPYRALGYRSGGAYAHRSKTRQEIRSRPDTLWKAYDNLIPVSFLPWYASCLNGCCASLDQSTLANWHFPCVYIQHDQILLLLFACNRSTRRFRKTLTMKSPHSEHLPLPDYVVFVISGSDLALRR